MSKRSTPKIFLRLAAISPLITGALCLCLGHVYWSYGIVSDADPGLQNALSLLAVGVAQSALSLIILLAVREGISLDYLTLPRGVMLLLGSLSLTLAGFWHTLEAYLGGALAFLAVTYFWSADATFAVSCQGE